MIRTIEIDETFEDAVNTICECLNRLPLAFPYLETTDGALLRCALLGILHDAQTVKLLMDYKPGNGA